MMELPIHSWPPGRLKMTNQRRNRRRGECPWLLTGQCFSIISVFIVTVFICAQAAEAQTVTSVRPRIRPHESPTHDKDESLLLKGSSSTTTTTSEEEESAKPTIIIPSPGAVALLVPRQEVDAHRNGTRATKNDKYPAKGVRGGSVVADTPSEAFIATTTTKSGRMMSSGTATATERTTTSEADDVESYPQNDQPAYFGQRQHQQEEDVDEGLDSGRGGYNYGNDKMSNGMAGGGSSSTASQQTTQRGHGTAAAAADSGNNNSNNNKSGDYGKGLANVDAIQCPSFTENSACPCYKFDDGE